MLEAKAVAARPLYFNASEKKGRVLLELLISDLTYY